MQITLMHGVAYTTNLTFYYWIEVKVIKLTYFVDTVKKKIWFLSFQRKKGTTMVDSNIVKREASNSGVEHLY